MFFASDNSGPVPQAVLDSLAEANSGYTHGYGADPWTAEVTDRIRTLFEAPQAEVFLVTTGTAANSLALAALCPPWHTVFCSPVAHIHEDECNAPEFYTGGAKLTLVPGSDMMTPDALRSAIEAEEVRGVHGPARGPVSITQVTERGNVHSLDQIRALTAVARDYGLPVHMDGARFANALVALGCTAAEMTWKAGVDVLSFGGTKNGLMGVEAVVFFNPDQAASFAHRRKRGGHLMSKNRYLAAQMLGVLRDDLWLDMARSANAACARLAAGLARHPEVTLLNDPRANMIFANLPRAWHQRAMAAGAQYYIWTGDLENGPADEPIMGRFVADWHQTDETVDALLAALTG